jgi:hypothetical protein
MDFIFNVIPSWIKTFRVKKYAKELSLTPKDLNNLLNEGPYTILDNGSGDPDMLTVSDEDLRKLEKILRDTIKRKNRLH